MIHFKIQINLFVVVSLKRLEDDILLLTLLIL